MSHASDEQALDTPIMKRQIAWPAVIRSLIHGAMRHFAIVSRTAVLGLAGWVLFGVMTPGAQGLPEWPENGHIRVLEAEQLSKDAAEAKYVELLDKLVAGYQRSGALDVDYRSWKRVSPTPYLSDPHGLRYVNVYVNSAGEEFGHATRDNPLPVGARLAKDSFSVIHGGATSRGPLFLMEKMPAGFWPEAGDWRYTMIMPNGKLFGTTKGTGSAAVEFCATCHEKAAARDFLFDLSDPAVKVAPKP